MSWIVGGWEDREGLLWVIARIEDARPSRQADTVKGPEGPYVVPKSFDREYDSMVEVIDPRTGRIVVSQRFDEVFSFVLGRGTVASVRELGDGRLNLAIRRLQLTKGR